MAGRQECVILLKWVNYKKPISCSYFPNEMETIKKIGLSFLVDEIIKTPTIFHELLKFRRHLTISFSRYMFNKTHKTWNK